MTAPLPPTEDARLAALRACGLLDSAPDTAFEDITLLAAQICDVPIAAITLVDENRQWFKSLVGMDVPETSRDVAFCAHTILQPDLMIVPNAEADPRFADNPFVTGDAHVRFYAGTPLLTPEGHAIGSLCVVDRIPRTLTPSQRAALSALGRQVARHLALQRAVAERDQAQAELSEYAERFETAVEAMQDGLVVQDAGGVVRVCNAAAGRILGLTTAQMMGLTSLDARWCGAREDGVEVSGEDPPMHSLRTGQTLRGVIMGVHRSDGELVWLSVNSVPLIRPGEALPHSVVTTFEDVTERKAAEDARARLAAIMTSSRDAITAITLEGVIVTWSPGAEQIYGYTDAEMVGNHVSVLAGPDQSSPVADVIQRLRRGEEISPVEAVRRRKDGRRIDVLLTFTPIRDATGELIGVAGIGRDITEQKRAEDTLLRERRFLNALLESLSEGIVACDADGTLSLFNEATRRFHGLPEQPLPPDRWAEYFDLFRADGVTPMTTDEIPLFRAFQGEVVRDAEMVIAPKGGPARILLASGQAIQDAQGQKLGAVVAMHDITERKRHEEVVRQAESQLRDYAVVLEAKMAELEATNGELERLATTDGLTGLKNSRAFRERLAEEFQRAVRYNTPLSLLLLDVDHFKQYNDSFGHPAGDAVLRQVAQSLAACARGTDLVARYGGEEFVVILPQTGGDGALIIAERIRISVAASPWDLRAVTVSVGVATLGVDVADPDTLVVYADDALYCSKAGGRNRVTLHRRFPAVVPGQTVVYDIASRRV